MSVRLALLKLVPVVGLIKAGVYGIVPTCVLGAGIERKKEKIQVGNNQIKEFHFALQYEMFGPPVLNPI